MPKNIDHTKYWTSKSTYPKTDDKRTSTLNLKIRCDRNKLPRLNQQLEDEREAFLYKKGLLGECEYRTDLKKRLGNRYFEMILRDRHLEE